MRARRPINLLALTLLLAAAACSSGAPRRVEADELARLLAEPVATMHSVTPLAISGERAYVERWSQGSDGGSIEIVWCPADELPDDVRARFSER